MTGRSHPAKTGYERLAQADQFSDESDDELLGQSQGSLQPASVARFGAVSTQPVLNRTGMQTSSSVKGAVGGPARPRARQRVGSNAGVDLKAINARLERWADEIAARFKRSGGRTDSADDVHLEIHHSVFQPPEGVRPITPEELGGLQPGLMSQDEFEAIVDSVRSAIDQEVHPSMISQGSSGSYFARDPDGKIVGVFKPKDEEPYAAGNPKWNKWIHRNLLIPNLSYVSEAAAYVLDCQLRTHLVPYTDVVWLSSKSFHYPFWDRRKFKRKKTPLPAKPGSFQVFLKGFKDANVFLREHPWPDQYWSGFRASDTGRRKGGSKRRWAENCRPSSTPPRLQDEDEYNSGRDGDGDGDDDDDDGDGDDENRGRGRNSPTPQHFAWTEPLKQSFREELEKLVILDYIMRNTDRGLDNWMVKLDWETGKASIVSDPLRLNMEPVAEENSPGPAPRPAPVQRTASNPAPRAANPYKSHKPMNATSRKAAANVPTVSLGAIDNSLSWPWKHPDAWRSFPFGWLFLPVDLIGRPFSQKTRDHFLPLLTSTDWWSQTSMALKHVFQNDNDFKERMFAKQLAVMKGQAWNVVEALKTPDHGPLELTRRTKVCVWDDLVDVPVAVPMQPTSPRNSTSAVAATAAYAHASRDKYSMDEADIAASAPANQSNRRYSFTPVTITRRSSGSIAQRLYNGDDLEGDLGYTAAEGQMGNQRKVIVERLEAVKSSPVFTWC
ncbi:phosphatidylinositol 4-kinase type 2, partial [Geosmithia morbida]